MTSGALEARISQVEVRPPEPIKPGTEGELEATRALLLEESNRVLELEALVQDLSARIKVANDLASNAYSGTFTRDAGALVLEVQELHSQLRRDAVHLEARDEKIRELEAQLGAMARPSSEKVAREMTQLRAEVNRLKMANAGLIDEYQRKFQLQERWIRDAIKIIEPLDQTSPEIQDIMHMLRTRPQELREEVMAKKISYQDAFDELAPILVVTLKQVAKSHVKEVAKTKVCIRAEYLAMQMQTRKSITTQTAIDLITGREELEKPISRSMALRAMELAALSNPKLLFEEVERKKKRLVWRANESPVA